MYLQSTLFKRGSILTRRGSRIQPVLEFMYNPATINRTRGWVYGTEAIPGRSTPVYGGGAGGPDTFNFVIPLDADRGFLVRRQRNAKMENADVENWLGRPGGGATFPADVNEKEDLRPYIDSFKRLVLPDAKASQGSFRSNVPPRTWIDLGSALSGEIEIDGIEEELWRFNNAMGIMRANLTLNGHMIEDSNVTGAQFLRKYTGSGTELPNVVHNAQFTDFPDVTDDGGLF